VVPFVSTDASRRAVRFLLVNQSRERAVRVRWFAELWRGGQLQDLPPVLRGELAHQVFLQPRETIEREVTLSPAHGKEGSDLGPALELGEPEDVPICCGAAWIDDLGDRAIAGPFHWLLKIDAFTLTQLAVDADIKRHFAGLRSRLNSHTLKKAAKELP
jgi:hypothetical protein